ncbi:cation-translocating P-type ATPase [Paraclostridium bifermentans]|uniref:cation-translocating P-type ATPase n=2 Tax=Peptostreptococcaceae TaxID=186804 RepID=UPI002FCCD9AB
MTTVNKVDGEVVMFTKGAPDVIFNRCKYALVGDEVVKASDEIIDEYKKMNEEFSNKALRVLAFATKRVENESFVPTIEDENNLTLIGLTAMIDPPREEVYEAVENARKSGIKTVMITGDHKTTAKAIAVDIGIFEDGDMALTGSELDALTDEELDRDLDHISVYARVSPENKIRIVKAWQRKGRVCAMTGDGVNDAPALKQADIGIGMGSGTEVAKDASDMVLVDDNFATIVNAVEVGRTVYTNIKKSIMYLFSGNLAGIIAILFAVFANLPNPFTTIQLLFINLVTDSLPAIALGLEKPEKGVMKDAPRDPNESILSKGSLGFVATRGIIIGAVTIAAQFIGMKHSPELGVSMAFATLTLSRIMQTFASRSNTETIFELGIKSNKYVLGAVGVCLIMFSLTLLPFMREIFTMPSSFNFTTLMTCFGLSVLATLAMEVSKVIKRK